MSDLPPGFVLDQQPGALPPGFELDQPSFLSRAGRYARGALDTITNGLTLGYGDELGAATDAAAQYVGLATPGSSNADSWQQRYDENLKAERDRRKQFSEQNPGTAVGLEVGGNILGAMQLPSRMMVGATLPTTMVKSGLTGAALGGLQGFGEGEGGFDNRMKGAYTGGAVGGTAGALVPVIGKGLGIAYEKAAPRILNKIADVADKFTTQVPLRSLSAAAPEGGMVTQDSLAATIADASRRAAGNVEEDAAIKRLALAMGSPDGVGKARQKLAALGEDAFIADTGKGTERLATVGNMTSDNAADKYAAAYAARNQGTGRRFINAMGEDAKVPNVRDAQMFLDAYKSRTGSELYDPALRGGKFNISEELTALQERPAIKKALETVDGWAAEHGKVLTDAERFHMVKQALNGNADAAFSAGKAVNKKMVGDTAGDWEKALWDANPAIKEADTAYAKIAPLSNPDKGNGYLERGYKFLKQGISPEAVEVSPAALAARSVTPEQEQAFRVGASNNMLDTAKSGPRSTRRLATAISENEILQQKLAEIYGPEQAAKLLQRSQAELEYAAGRNRVTAGSPTAERGAALAREMAIDPVPTSGGDIGRVFDWVKTTLAKTDKASEPVRARLADLLANPSKEMNAETLSLVEAMLKRQAMTRPASSGLSGAAGGYASNP